MVRGKVNQQVTGGTFKKWPYINGSYMVSIHHSEKEWVLAPPLKVLVVLYLPKFMVHMRVQNKFSMAMWWYHATISLTFHI